MEPKAGDEVLFLRHILSSKALQPLLALVSYETDEEQYWGKSSAVIIIFSNL
tara:strand:+ start:157 stop:312 length:156 start_codon:yes stop_codon:yes gene_type:complete